jgi:hypothetical protein
MTIQLGTPREVVMSTAASLPSVMKPNLTESNQYEKEPNLRR